MTKKELLDRCAKNADDRLLLARVLDKAELAFDRGVPSCTQFLSPGEQAAVTDLLNACGHPRHLFFGGFEDAERRVCAFLPDWQEEEDFLEGEDMAVCAVETQFPGGGSLTHRDILGSLMGLGITREKLGDILLPEPGTCQVVVLKEAVSILTSQWEGAGRYKCREVRQIPLSSLAPKPPQIKTIRDTVASPRLDAVLSSAFSLSRSKAAAYIAGGKVAVNHRECLKSDKTVEEGDVLTCRGLGKCVVKEVPGQSRKGRTMLVLERYI